MSHPALNLTARDFDAYLPEKATSNAYSRPRLEVKQRVLAWGRDVVGRLAEIGIPVDMHASDEHPSLRNKKRVECQWIFFWRDQAARDELDRLLYQGRSISAEIDDPSPYTRHAFLAFRIDASTVDVCFAVHPDAKVDIDNLRARLAPAGDVGGGDGGSLAEELLRALRALPEEFAVGVRAEDRIACNAATSEAILDMLARAAAGQTPLWIGWSIPRATAIAHSELLDEQLEDAIVALAPIYRLVAWSRENDHIALDRRIEGLEQERARTHAEAVAQSEKWQAEQAAARERSRMEAKPRTILEEAPRRQGPPFRGAPQGRKPSLDNLFKPQGARGGGDDGGRKPREPRVEADGSPDVAQATHSAHSAQQTLKADHAGKGSAAPQDDAGSAPFTTSPGGSQTSSGIIEKGARVRVRTGAFADKVGIVGELDGRGGARVLLGLLSTRLDVSDLEAVPEGRERPALQSSHRKPLPAAPRKTR
jgi:hypothetical protein